MNKEKEATPKKGRRADYQGALTLVEGIWEAPTKITHGAADDPCTRTKCAIIAAKKRRADLVDAIHPYSGKTMPKATLYPPKTAQGLDIWLKELTCRRTGAPTEKQLPFLRGFVERMKAEAREEQSGDNTNSPKDPIFDFLHGVPGCGKSQI